VKRKPLLRDQAVPVLLVAFFVLALLVFLWTAGWPQGADTWGHLARAEYLAGVMRTEGPGAYFRAAWMPNWYIGDPFLTYYPPLTTLLLAPLIYLLGDSQAALRVLISCFFIGFSALTFFYIQRTWNRWAGFLGTVLAVAAPYQIRTIFFEGNLPRMLALLALPAIAILTDRVLSARERRAPAVVLLGISWTWAILAHTQQALIFAIGIGLYLVLRLILDPEVPLSRLAPWIAAVALGALFAAPWLIPAYSHGELANIPFLPAEKIPIFSAMLDGFLPYLDLTHGQILFGFGAILIGLLAIGARPDPRRTAWYLAGGLAVWFALGPSGVFFSLLPFNNQLLPERFVNFAAFAVPIAAAGLLPLGKNLRAIRAFLLVILVTVDLIPSLRILPGGDYPSEQAVLAAAAPADGGRVALLTYPEPTSLEVYFAGRGADLINGWALENTPHHVAIRRVLSAPDWGPEYLAALFSRWDVRTAVVSGGAEADPARAAVAGMGFRLAGSFGRYEIWRSAVTSERVQVLPAQSMLVVGTDLSPFLAAFPFAEEASPEEFLDSHAGRLQEYPLLGLYRFASNSTDLKSYEEILKNYLDAGGSLVVDLSGMEDFYGRTLDFFGVHTLRIAFDDPIQMQWQDPAAGLPDQLHLSDLIETGWSGASYEGLDVVLAAAEWQGSSFPVLGYKNVGRGKVWFVGANLLYYAQLAHEDALRDHIRGLVLAGSTLLAETSFAPVPVSGYVETADGIRFDYTAGEPVNALVSYTYSPRWRAVIDGYPMSLSERDHLIRIPLPAGTHHVEIRYDAFGTVWPWLGLLAGMIGVFGAAAGWFMERRLLKKQPAHRDILDVFQKPDTPESGGAYVPCPHCGFRLAESRPPTPITYPFQVSHCPICGAQMDDEGFEPGKDLSREDRARALHAWLRANHYDPRMIHSQWGFSLDEFFKQ
jgi:hypothetical protein